jgi:hypothetical protein
VILLPEIDIDVSIGSKSSVTRTPELTLCTLAFIRSCRNVLYPEHTFGDTSARYWALEAFLSRKVC